MAEYIKRKEYCENYCRCSNEYCDRQSCPIWKAPAADVAPVVHGRWECVYDDSRGETYITCSHCKNTRTINGCFVSTDGKSYYFEDDYCPNCGAKMGMGRGGENASKEM